MRREAQSAVVVPLTAGTLVAMPLGVLLLLKADPVLMKRGFSAAILSAALVLLSGWRYRGTIGRIGWVGVGALAGVVMGSTSIAVTAALFLNAGSQTARESRANFIVWVFIATRALACLSSVPESPRPDRCRGVLAPVYVVPPGTGCGRVSEVGRRAVLALVVVIATVGLLV